VGGAFAIVQTSEKRKKERGRIASSMRVGVGSGPRFRNMGERKSVRWIGEGTEKGMHINFWPRRAVRGKLVPTDEEGGRGLEPRLYEKGRRKRAFGMSAGRGVYRIGIEGVT